MLLEPIARYSKSVCILPCNSFKSCVEGDISRLIHEADHCFASAKEGSNCPDEDGVGYSNYIGWGGGKKPRKRPRKASDGPEKNRNSAFRGEITNYKRKKPFPTASFIGVLHKLQLLVQTRRLSIADEKQHCTCLTIIYCTPQREGCSFLPHRFQRALQSFIYPPPPQPVQRAAGWWHLRLSGPIACHQGTCFPPHRSLSSIITGLENDSGRQLRLTVWGPNVNSALLGKTRVITTITSVGGWKERNWSVFHRLTFKELWKAEGHFWSFGICNFSTPFFAWSHIPLWVSRAQSHQQCLEWFKQILNHSLFLSSYENNRVQNLAW